MQASRNPEEARGVVLIVRRGGGDGRGKGGEIGVGGVDVHGHAADGLQVAQFLGHGGRTRLVVNVVEGKLLDCGFGGG